MMDFVAWLLSGLAIVALFLSLGESNRNHLTTLLAPRRSLKSKIRPAGRLKPIEVLLELPDFASLLWFAVSAGESLENAIRIAVSRSQGYVSGEFLQVLRNVDHGALLQIELQNLAAETKSEQVRELATKLAVSLINGSALAELLGGFVSSTTAELRSALLAKAGSNETKMMIPLVFVILPVTVLFSVYPSLALIQGSFL